MAGEGGQRTKSAVVLKVSGQCPHCRTTLESLRDMVQAMKAFSRYAGLYLFLVETGELYRVLPSNKKAAASGVQKVFPFLENPTGYELSKSQVPEVSRSVRQRLEKNDGVPEMVIFQDPNNPLRGKHAMFILGFQTEGADTNPNSDFQAGDGTSGSPAALLAQSVPPARERRTKKKKSSSPASSSSSTASSSSSPKPTKEPHPREATDRFVREAERAANQLEEAFACQRGAPPEAVDNFFKELRDAIFQPGYPFGGLVLLREGCPYCKRAQAAQEQAEHQLDRSYPWWKGVRAPAPLTVTFPAGSPDNSLVTSLKRWGMDSFPSLLLLRQTRERLVQGVACIELDKNTSNVEVWTEFLLAVRLPGQVFRRARASDANVFAGVRRATDTLPWIQDDVYMANPVTLLRHANWEGYLSLVDHNKGNEGEEREKTETQ